VSRQCALTGVARSSLHSQQGPKVVDKEDLRISQLIDEQYTKRPFFGTRRMKTFLRRRGEPIGRKRVQIDALDGACRHVPRTSYE